MGNILPELGARGAAPGTAYYRSIAQDTAETDQRAVTTDSREPA